MTTAPAIPTARPLPGTPEPAAAPHPHGTGHLPAITTPPHPQPGPATEPAEPRNDLHTAATTGAPTPAAAAQERASRRLTRGHKALVVLVVLGVVAIAGIGFAGSYHAVTAQAQAKGFGWFSHWITIGVDAGIGVFLGLDLLLTWLRMPYPLLRPGAWFLTGATITFNASASWPDPIGVGMHATIPLLFVLAVEAARHSLAWAADLAVQEHTETPPLKRWLLAPWPTFCLWRRQSLWQIRSYTTVLDLEKQRREFRAMLRSVHGRNWRRNAHPADVLALRFTGHGMTVAAALHRAETELAIIAERAGRRNATAPRNGETTIGATEPAVARNAPGSETQVGETPAATPTTPGATRNATPETPTVAGDETQPDQGETAPAMRNAARPQGRNATPDTASATGRETAVPVSTLATRGEQLRIVGRFVEEWNGPDDKLPLQPIADALGRSKPTASRLVAAYREMQKSA